MTTFPAVLVLTMVLAAVSGSKAGLFKSNTYVSNWSTRQLRATIAFSPTDNAFRDRLVDPYTWQSTDYWNTVAGISVEMWIEGSQFHEWVRIRDDRSVVAFDNGLDVDIYLVQHGKLIVIDQTEPEKLATLYPA